MDWIYISVALAVVAAAFVTILINRKRRIIAPPPPPPPPPPPQPVYDTGWLMGILGGLKIDSTELDNLNVEDAIKKGRELLEDYGARNVDRLVESRWKDVTEAVESTELNEFLEMRKSAFLKLLENKRTEWEEEELSEMQTLGSDEEDSISTEAVLRKYQADLDKREPFVQHSWTRLACAFGAKNRIEFYERELEDISL